MSAGVLETIVQGRWKEGGTKKVKGKGRKMNGWRGREKEGW